MQIVKVTAHEADDVVASLVEQVVGKGYHAVFAYPFKLVLYSISTQIHKIICPFLPVSPGLG
ncbi:hypothetical protein Hanom_Chr07g00609051 [Helianthus anomalus]